MRVDDSEGVPRILREQQVRLGVLDGVARPHAQVEAGELAHARGRVHEGVARGIGELRVVLQIRHGAVDLVAVREGDLVALGGVGELLHGDAQGVPRPHGGLLHAHGGGDGPEPDEGGRDARPQGPREREARAAPGEQDDDGTGDGEGVERVRAQGDDQEGEDGEGRERGDGCAVLPFGTRAARPRRLPAHAVDDRAEGDREGGEEHVFGGGEGVHPDHGIERPVGDDGHGPAPARPERDEHAEDGCEHSGDDHRLEGDGHGDAPVVAPCERAPELHGAAEEQRVEHGVVRVQHAGLVLDGLRVPLVPDVVVEKPRIGGEQDGRPADDEDGERREAEGGRVSHLGRGGRTRDARGEAPDAASVARKGAQEAVHADEAGEPGDDPAGRADGCGAGAAVGQREPRGRGGGDEDAEGDGGDRDAAASRCLIPRGCRGAHRRSPPSRRLSRATARFISRSSATKLARARAPMAAMRGRLMEFTPPWRGLKAMGSSSTRKPSLW